MGYNGMPDGRGFKDEKMDWGSNQSNYICHAELNTIIAAFRRSANLSSCTLYVTHSPCEDCSKLIAQSGIKNVVFAKYYKEGKHMYKCLGHTPDMNITHYEYKDSGYGNGAKIRIDLERLKVTTTESTESPAPTTAPILTSVEESTTSPGITVEWEALRCDCNGLITGYSVQCVAKNGTDKQEQYVESGTTKATFERLIPFTNYSFQVAAMNSSGIGVYSVAKSLNAERDCYPSTGHHTVKGRREVNLPLDDYFMALAVLATTRSPYATSEWPNKDPVGACIVLQEPRRAISVGYNGFPEGYKGKRTTTKEGDKGKRTTTEDYNECCAEHNAIVSAFRYHADLTNCILYTTAPPCHKCAQMIVQSGIKTVVYGNGDKTMSEESVEIFYWAKVATLEYKLQTKKKIITIDLHRQTVEQTE
jgi:deoxycytidylate deaminase